MKTEFKKILEKEKAEMHAAEDNSRRDFLKKAAAGGIALGGMMNASIEDTIDYTTQRVSRASSPADLRITDMRYAVVQNVGRTPIIRIDTNQGIYGLGEVRDSGDERYALMLKSRILGQNPCNVEMIFKIIKQFGYHGRQAGGVCGVEGALWDLCGKAYNVPAWQLLGGKYRTKVRLYSDTPGATNDPSRLSEWTARVRERIEVQKFTWLKADFNAIRLAPDAQNTVVNYKFWNSSPQSDRMLGGTGSTTINYMGSYRRNHPFTQMQLTDKALEGCVEFVDRVRSIVGWETPVSTDHYGTFDINNHIRMGRKLEKYRLAWLEDTTQWWYFDQLRTIREALETPICTGEDIFGLRGPGLALGFKDLIDAKCVDIIHPDLASAGGLLETKRICDYAQNNGIAAAFHQAGTPVNFMCNVHCAAATENFLALEHHSVDTPWWPSLVRMTGSQPMVTDGFANLPLDAPGLGIELNDDVVKEHLIERDKSYFVPTPEWDDIRSQIDRIWS